jgi:glycosyltransferase 2 family protein
LRNRSLAALLGVAITVALLAWVLRDVSLAEVWHQARRAHPGWLLLAVALTTSTFVLRVFRWRLLLLTEDGRAVARLPMWHAVAIGFMANNILPFRAGELLRVFAISRLAPVKASSALSSVVLERLFDGLAIITLLFVGLVSAGIPAGAEVAGIRVADLATRTAIFVGILLAACVGALVFPRAAHAVIRRVAPARLAGRIAGVLDGILAGLGALAAPGRVIGVTAWSFVIWLVNGASFSAAFAAFGIDVGFGGALLLQSLLVLGIAVPSTPGFFGPFEAAIKAVLLLFAVESSAAVAYGLTYHFTTFVPITLLGLWSLARTPVSLQAARGGAP